MVIRTLDVGADKFSTNFESVLEQRNPVLGLRSVRHLPPEFDLVQNANACDSKSKCIR